MPVHVSAEELADASAGLVDLARADQIAAHLAECPACRETDAGLRQVSRLLAAVPAPAMPAAVAARLDAVVQAESVRRQGGQPVEAPERTSAEPTSGERAGGGVAEAAGRSGSVRSGSHGWSRVPLGELEYSTQPPRRALWGLAAAVAGIVGFGGYVLGASAGLEEAPVGIVAVDSGQLGRQAELISNQADLGPRRFYPEWTCAREVTDGRITGLTRAIVDGAEALLVYTEAGGTTRVTVVTGCAEGEPAAGPTTVVKR